MQGKLADFFPDLVTSRQLSRADAVADEVREEMALDAAIGPYLEDYVGAAEGAGRGGAALHLEDVSGIPFVSDIAGVAEYQHRARVRAGDGDLFSAATAPVAGYEAYCREKLGLGAPDFMQPVVASSANASSSMAIATALGTDASVAKIADWMGERGDLTIHPYMAIESVWALARRLNRVQAARGGGLRARVLGPPPPVLWVANDKAVLSDIIARLSDGAWNVETRRESTPRAMAGALKDLASRHRMVGLKRTRCASAMGNIVFDGEAIRQAGAGEVEALVDQFLRKTQWEDDEPVIAVEWAESRESPSTQLWIPPLSSGHISGAKSTGDEAAGQIRLDGIYQQILSGPHGLFVGSRPSTLPQAVERKLAEASFVVAAVFQRLGYVGRCSFDFIVTGDPEGDFEVRMIECNGRWGGTSTPMHLVDRLVEGPRPAYLAQDYVHPGLVGAKLVDVLAAVGDALFDVQSGKGRFIFYNCGPLAPAGKIDVISLGDSPAEALDGVRRVLPRRLGLD